MLEFTMLTGNLESAKLELERTKTEAFIEKNKQDIAESKTREKYQKGRTALLGKEKSHSFSRNEGSNVFGVGANLGINESWSYYD